MKNLIYPCLWFDGKAGEAADFYCKVFKNSKITSSNPMVTVFESNNQKFMCLNGGPEFSINHSISFFILCKTVEETENLWFSLLEGGSALMPLDKYEFNEKYGWVQDKFGVSWQLFTSATDDVGQKFTPTFMFTGKNAGKAEEAVNYYTSLFEGSEIVGILKYTKEENANEGLVKHAQFKLGRNIFMAMDSSLEHDFSFNEAISLVIECETQDEIDFYWNNLSKGGSEGQCGWLKDKFGVSWQIIPEVLEKLMNDPSKTERVVNAFLKMKKFEIDKLVNA